MIYWSKSWSVYAVTTQPQWKDGLDKASIKVILQTTPAGDECLREHGASGNTAESEKTLKSCVEWLHKYNCSKHGFDANSLKAWDTVADTAHPTEG